MFERLDRTLIFTALHMQVPKMKMHVCLLETSVTLPNDSAVFTRLDYVERSIQGSNSNEVVYT